MAHPALRQVQGNARLQGADAEGVAQAARACGPADDLRQHHRVLDDAPSGDAMARPYLHYTKRDYRELKDGEGGGNCAALAYTKKVKLERMGVKSSIMACVLQTGEGHAFLLTDVGVLDNRFDEVVSLSQITCKY